MQKSTIKNNITFFIAQLSNSRFFPNDIIYSPKRKESLCMNYQSYLKLPAKRAVIYDVVVIDGLCRQYAAYYVISLIISNT